MGIGEDGGDGHVFAAAFAASWSQLSSVPPLSNSMVGRGVPTNVANPGTEGFSEGAGVGGTEV